VLAFLAAALRGIAGPWLAGHDGGNGAAFAQAARNSLRFDVVPQTRYYTGLATPPRDEFYASHPLLLHLHLIVSFTLLGVAEWSARLVPALYSLGTVLLLFATVARLAGRRVALLAVALFVLTPLHLVYANMVDHEQGGIFWCLAFVHLDAIRRDTRRRRDAVLALLALSLALQFDWPPYTLAFLFFVGALVRRDARWAVALAAVTAANLLAFALFATQVAGVESLETAFRVRSQRTSGEFALLAERLWRLHGPVLLALLVAWLGWFLARARRRRFRPADRVVGAFLVVQVVHSAVFPNAGYHHAYWTYYAGPGAAVAGAEVLRAIGARLPRPAAAVGLFLVLLGQGVSAWTGFQWGHATGRGSNVEPYRAERSLMRFTRELGRRYGRGAQYALHPSFTLDAYTRYYLDAPIRERLGPRRPNEIVLIDLERVETPNLLLRRLVAEDGTLMLDRRLLAIDRGRPGAGLEALVTREEPTPAWWRWFVDPGGARTTWAPDPDPAAARAVLNAGTR